MICICHSAWIHTDPYVSISSKIARLSQSTRNFVTKRGVQCVGQESGTVFDEVELEEREWTDYDEKVELLALITFRNIANAYDFFRVPFQLELWTSRGSGVELNGFMGNRRLSTTVLQVTLEPKHKCCTR